MVEMHVARDADITIAAQPVAVQDATRFGLLQARAGRPDPVVR